MMKLKAFALIELVVVMLIIAVVAVVAIPKMMNLQLTAILNSEEKIVAALKTAVQTRHLENIVSGRGDVWPGQAGDPLTNPYTLLNNPPPNKFYTFPGDGKKWMYLNSVTYFYILCPHYYYGRVAYGCYWIYNYNSTTIRDYSNQLIPRGDIRLAWRATPYATRGHK